METAFLVLILVADYEKDSFVRTGLYLEKDAVEGDLANDPFDVLFGDLAKEALEGVIEAFWPDLPKEAFEVFRSL